MGPGTSPLLSQQRDLDEQIHNSDPKFEQKSKKNNSSSLAPIITEQPTYENESKAPLTSPLKPEDVTIDIANVKETPLKESKVDANISIRVEGNQFRDLKGRQVLLRGVNVSGSAKMPTTPLGSTHLKKNLFKNVESVDFVGRPFPLDECNAHFRRLRCWGFNYIRLVITWEAIEHRGPGLYDEKYIKYLREVARIAGENDIYIYVDPHQDVWSRFTGGCGAPAWTLELAGFDLQNMGETGACITQQEYDPSPDAFPLMLWPTNLYKLACATMFTLFWSGKDFAPKLNVGEGGCRVEKLSCIKLAAGVRGEPDDQKQQGEEKEIKLPAGTRTVSKPTNIQDYLQGCYIAAMRAVAKELRGLPNVLGFGTMNEPHNGYHGLTNLNSVWGQLTNGVFPTPFQSFCAADGMATKVRNYVPGCCAFVCGCAIDSFTLNPLGKRAWLPGRECVWKMHGVWEMKGTSKAGAQNPGSPVLNKPGYFNNGKDWSTTYYLPFAQRYAQMLHEIEEDWHCYIEIPPAGVAPGVKFPRIRSETIPNAVNATHWYDGFSLFSGNLQINWNVDVETAIPKFGACSVRAMFKRQIASIRSEGEREIEGGAPTVIGEFGIPYNANGNQFQTGDFSRHSTLLDANFAAMEANLVHYTVWNYTPDNCNKYGDQWNFEDLSIYSKDQSRKEDEKEPPSPDCKEEVLGPLRKRFLLTNQEAMRRSFLYNGGRTLDAVARPYAQATNGTLIESRYVMTERTYSLRFRRDSKMAVAATKVFIPLYPYERGFDVTLSNGSVSLHVHKDNYGILEYTTSPKDQICSLRITPMKDGCCG